MDDAFVTTPVEMLCFITASNKHAWSRVGTLSLVVRVSSAVI
jgi:hypothetical protein